jgi:hypothetical protein
MEYCATHLEKFLISELKHRLPDVEIHFMYPKTLHSQLCAQQNYPKALHEIGSLGFRGKTVDELVRAIHEDWLANGTPQTLFVFQIVDFRTQMFAPIMYVSYEK